MEEKIKVKYIGKVPQLVYSLDFKGRLNTGDIIFLRKSVMKELGVLEFEIIETEIETETETETN